MTDYIPQQVKDKIVDEELDKYKRDMDELHELVTDLNGTMQNTVLREFSMFLDKFNRNMFRFSASKTVDVLDMNKMDKDEKELYPAWENLAFSRSGLVIHGGRLNPVRVEELIFLLKAPKSFKEIDDWIFVNRNSQYKIWQDFWVAMKDFPYVPKDKDLAEEGVRAHLREIKSERFSFTYPVRNKYRGRFVEAGSYYQVREVVGVPQEFKFNQERSEGKIEIVVNDDSGVSHVAMIVDGRSSFESFAMRRLLPEAKEFVQKTKVAYLAHQVKEKEWLEQFKKKLNQYTTLMNL